LVELSPDFHAKLLDGLPVFPLVKFIVNQDANAVVEFRAQPDLNCHGTPPLQDSIYALALAGLWSPLLSAVLAWGLSSWRIPILSDGHFPSILSSIVSGRSWMAI
jgi:hypothetical protein